jgi:branched-chain amino acid transport system substrate-binding protein
VVLAVASTVLAACSTSGPGQTAPAGSPGVSGAPVKVLAVTTPRTERNAQNGLKMAQAYINATGGINGRPLSIIICSDNERPNTAAACVRSGISQGAVAEIDRTSYYGASLDPVEQAAGMAVLGGGPFSQADFAAPNLFPLNLGLFISTGAAPLAVKVLGAKKIGVPHTDDPAADALPATLEGVLAPLGASVVGAVPIAPTAADITPQVSAAVQARPEVIIDGLTEDAYVKFIQGMQQQGSTAKFMVNSGVMDAGRITQYLGASAKDIYQVAEDNYQSAGYQQFAAACKKYCPDPSNMSGHVIWAWEAAVLFRTVAAKAPAIDSKGIAAAAAQVTDFTIDNIIPPVSFTKPGTALGGKVPRLFNDTLWLFQFQNGQLVPVGDGQGVKTLG